MRLSHANSTVTSFAGIDGDIQLVVGSRGLIVLDAQGAERGTDGVLRHSHGVVRLTYDAARELAAFIDHMGEPTDPRQAALWSPATFTEPVRPPARNRRQRRAAA
jgi:hypothetical protein